MTKYLRQSTLTEEGLVWLMVSEVSGYVTAPCCFGPLAARYILVGVCGKGNHMAARKQRESSEDAGVPQSLLKCP